MKKKIKFKITDKEMQLLTVIILFLSLTISIWGNLEQIKQNKFALYNQAEYLSLSEYKNDFVLCSEDFLSLLEGAMQNNVLIINKKFLEDDLNLSRKLRRESCVLDGFLERYSINEKEIQNLSFIMSETFVIAKSKAKNDKAYQYSYVISKKDLIYSLNEANKCLSRTRQINHIKFKPQLNMTLEEYRSIYLPNIEKIHAGFDKILIERFIK